MSRITLIDAARQVRANTIAETLLTQELRDKINAAGTDLATLQQQVSSLQILQDTDATTFQQLQSLILALQNVDGDHDTTIATLQALADAATVDLAAEIAARTAGDAALQTAVDAATVDLAAEIAARTAGDAALQTAVDAAQAAADAAQVDADTANTNIGDMTQLGGSSSSTGPWDASIEFQGATYTLTEGDTTNALYRTAEPDAGGMYYWIYFHENLFYPSSDMGDGTFYTEPEPRLAANPPSLATVADTYALQPAQFNAVPEYTPYNATSTVATYATVVEAINAAFTAISAIKIPEMRSARFATNGTTQVFTLPSDADLSKFIAVYDNGQLLTDTEDYMRVGADVSFDYAPLSQDRVYVHYYTLV